MSCFFIGKYLAGYLKFNLMAKIKFYLLTINKVYCNVLAV